MRRIDSLQSQTERLYTGSAVPPSQRLATLPFSVLPVGRSRLGPTKSRHNWSLLGIPLAVRKTPEQSTSEAGALEVLVILVFAPTNMPAGKESNFGLREAGYSRHIGIRLDLSISWIDDSGRRTQNEYDQTREIL